MDTKKTVSLVLGSGGARGLAHIGIIHWLEENGYEIKAIAGCSMGALVGGIHAIGKLDEFEGWVRKVTKADILALLDVSLGSDGLIKGDRIIGTLKDLVGDAQIEELPVEFTAVAANISKRKEVWFRKGPLFDAIKASISLPLIFKPFSHNGDDLIDGGILNPVPIAPTFNNQTDFTVAVNLCAPQVNGVEIAPVKREESSENGSFITQTVVGVVESVTDILKKSKTDFRAYDILYKSFDAMQGTIARQKIAAYPPDYVIAVPANLCGMMEFDRAERLIKYGYEKAADVLPQELGKE